jgi:hypothetical protein
MTLIKLSDIVILCMIVVGVHIGAPLPMGSNDFIA